MADRTAVATLRGTNWGDYRSTRSASARALRTTLRILITESLPAASSTRSAGRAAGARTRSTKLGTATWAGTGSLHPVDALHLENNALGEGIGHGARHRHDRLRSGIRRPPGQPMPQGSHIPTPATPSRVILPDRSPEHPQPKTAPLVGLGEAPLVLQVICIHEHTSAEPPPLIVWSSRSAGAPPASHDGLHRRASRLVTKHRCGRRNPFL